MRVLEFEVATRSPYLYELATRDPQSSIPNNISRLSIRDTQLQPKLEEYPVPHLYWLLIALIGSTIFIDEERFTTETKSCLILPNIYE